MQVSLRLLVNGRVGFKPSKRPMQVEKISRKMEKTMRAFLASVAVVLAGAVMGFSGGCAEHSKPILPPAQMTQEMSISGSVPGKM